MKKKKKIWKFSIFHTRKYPQKARNTRSLATWMCRKVEITESEKEQERDQCTRRDRDETRETRTERESVCEWKSAPNTRFILHISCLSSRCVSFFFLLRCYIVLTELLSGLTAFGILCTVVIPPTHNQIITKSGMYPHIRLLCHVLTHRHSFCSERTNKP